MTETPPNQEIRGGRIRTSSSVRFDFHHTFSPANRRRALAFLLAIIATSMNLATVQGVHPNSTNGRPQDSPSHDFSKKSSPQSTSTSTPSNSWTELGPRPISAEAPIITTFGATPMSGRVGAIAVNSSNTQIIYLGAGHGGIWRSADSGQTWTPLTDNQASLATGAVALSPDQKILYVGTGEATHSGISYYGQGLLKSTDSGQTWNTLGLRYFGNSSISGILIQPSNQTHILVSTTWGACCGKSLGSKTNPLGTGVYLSLDGGQTWPTIFQTSATYPNSGFAQLLQDPTNSSIVYAGDFAGTIWRSTNFGAIWTPFASYTTPSLQGRVALAMSPISPNTLYAAFSNANGGLNGIFRYDIPSRTNVTLATPPGPPVNPSDTACGFQCNYDLVLAADPSNSAVIYFAARDLYSSNNGGASWTDRGGLWYPQQSSIHPDQHSLVFIPGTSSLLDGNDGGIWKTSDQGATWTNLNGGLGTTELYSLALSPSSTSRPSIIAGSQDNGLLGFYPNSSSWSQRITGDGGFTGFEATNPSIAYMMDDATFYKSIDGGNTWNPSSTGINANDANLFLPPVEQDPKTAGTIYLGGTDVYKTTNFAASWTDISGPLTNPGRITALAIAPSNSSTIYIGDVNGLVRVSTNGGSTWTTILSTILRPVSYIDVDPASPSKIYVSYARGLTPVLETTSNQGVSWAAVATSGLPNASIVNVKLLTNAILLGTDTGVYYTTNSGTSWSRLGTGLPNIAINSMTVFSNRLYVSTLGRGAWSTSLTSIMTTINSCQTITAPGTYVLSQDLILNSSSFIASVVGGLIEYTCFWIDSNSVVLDGNGHHVTGLGPLGGPGNQALDNSAVLTRSPTVANWNSSTIKNFVVNGFGRGILVNLGFNNLVQGNTVSNAQEGISFAAGTENSTIANNIIFTGNGRGIAFYSFSSSPNSAFNTVTGNQIVNNTIGIDLSNTMGGLPNHNRIYNNFFANNTIQARDPTGQNSYNVTKAPGSNVVGGPFIGGNFWSDYSGNDTDFDGIGETLLPYTSSGNIASGGDSLPLTISLNRAVNFAGLTVTTLGNFPLRLTSFPSTISLSGTLAINATITTTGATAFFGRYTIARVPLTGGLLLAVFVRPYVLSSNIIFSASGTNITASVSVSRNVDINVDGKVDAVDNSIFTSSYLCSVGQTCYNPLADFDANGVVNLLDFQLLARLYGSQELYPMLTPGNFTVSSPPIPIGQFVGTPVTTEIDVAGSGNVGTVNLFYYVTISGIVCTFSQTTLSTGASTSLTCIASSPGAYSVNVAAVHGSQGYITTTAQIFMFDFSVTVSQTSLSIRAGSSNLTSITVGASLYWINQVWLNVTIPSGLNISLQFGGPYTGWIPANGNSFATLTLSVASNVPVGTYTVTLEGECGGLIHTVPITITVH